MDLQWSNQSTSDHRTRKMMKCGYYQLLSESIGKTQTKCEKQIDEEASLKISLDETSNCLRVTTSIFLRYVYLQTRRNSFFKDKK